MLRYRSLLCFTALASNNDESRILSFDVESMGSSVNDLDGELEFEKLMQSKYKAQKQQITDQEKSLPEIESIVRTFDHCRLKTTENIFSFWERNEGTYPVLYELATIILPVPGTEINVERLFSQLRFILHPL